MPLEESSYTEPAQATPEVAPAPPVEAPEAAPEPLQASEPAPVAAETPEVPQPPANEPAAVTPEPAPVEAAPAFNEADFFKQALGDDAPKSAAELKERYEGLRAKQITPEVEAQLAILRDPAKMQEFASIAGKDYDKPTAAEVMREKFALDNPKMPESLREREFGKQFSKDFPLIAQALNNPDPADEDYIDPEDPAFKAELEAADYYSQAAREALKTNQQEATQKFIAATAAPQAPLLTPAQEADAKALPAWLDEAIKDGGTLPVELPDGTKYSLPIEKAADFKAAFNDSYKLLDAFVLGKDGLLNRQNQALFTAFIQNPQAFVQNIAQQAIEAAPKPKPAIPVADLTNSSASQPQKLPAAPVAATRNASRDADWQRFNV